VLAGTPDNERATQYPPYFSSLPNFNATAFMQTVKTGIEPDGTVLSTKYWFVEKPQKNVYDAMEGYLYPDHYNFLTTADTTTVIETMVEQLGAQFCPGPASNFTQYIDTLADCKSHPAMIGTKSIFTTMEAAYHTKDDTLAIYDTLIMASMTSHEAAGPTQAPGVVGVLWTRYEALKGYIPNAVPISDLGTDASAQYARDNESPPKNGKWWAPLTTAGSDVAKTNPYNNYSDLSILPPGPIDNPSSKFILAAAAPTLSKYWFYVHDHCGNIHYAVTATQFNAEAVKYVNDKLCSTSPTS
jgi:cell division protein YceG involved in septum cleavage